MHKIWTTFALLLVGALGLLTLISFIFPYTPEGAEYAGRLGYDMGSSLIPMVFGICVAYVLISHFMKKKVEGKQP